MIRFKKQSQLSYKLRIENQATTMPLSAKQFCNLLLAMPRIINGSINMAPFYTTIIIWAPCRCGKIFCIFLFSVLHPYALRHFYRSLVLSVVQIAIFKEPSLQGELGKSLKLCPYKGIMFKVSTRNAQSKTCFISLRLCMTFHSAIKCSNLNMESRKEVSMLKEPIC